MAVETLLKLMCGNNGSMDYERLLDLSYGLPEISDLDQMLESSEIFTVVPLSDSKEVFIQTDLKLCKYSECRGLCSHLHLCKYELMTGHCGRRVCVFGHKLMSEHNIKVLRDHQMIGLSREDLRVILLQNDSNLLPPVCVSYNRGGGPYGHCPEREQCTRLHVCKSFITRSCDVTGCNRSHVFSEPHALTLLRRRGVPDDLTPALPFIYHNILTLRSRANTRAQTEPVAQKGRCEPLRRTAENDICLSFVKNFCKTEHCSRIHFKMPYKWEVKVGNTWTALPNNEEIERDYCDPSNIYSSGVEPVCFEDMTLGLDEVRRLSTEPSVLLPSFILTTTWAWYWRDEYHHWIQFASVKEMHRLSSVSSDDLEKKYQKYLRIENPSDQDAVVKFRAGEGFYELNFKDMTQRNEVSGRERRIRRRPVFVSAVEVQIARTSSRSLTAGPRVFKGVPGFWDQSAIPYSGFQRVCLQPTHRDYVRVQNLFSESMRGFTVSQIERVQNRKLWENFITKKEQMKNANREKSGERFLFHGIRSSLVDVVCRRNFHIEMSDTTVYGKGIYFSKDARSCSKKADEGGERVMKADEGGERLMFVCRVLLGYYTRGEACFLQPPARNAEGHLFDSCVNNPRDPSVFVLFDRSQIYPEFLVTYKQNKPIEVSDVKSTDISHVVCPTLSAAQVNVRDVSQTPKTSDVVQNSTTGTNPPPSSAPVKSFTATPSSAPVMSLTATPSSAPVMSFTATPSSAPVMSFTATPPSAPVMSFTATPSSAPVMSFTATPPSAPVMSFTATPPSAPVKSFTATPSSAPVKSFTATPPSAPVMSLTATPPSAPVMSFTATPPSAPVMSFTATPSSAPVMSLTATPSSAPVMSPTATPGSAPVSEHITPSSSSSRETDCLSAISGSTLKTDPGVSTRVPVSDVPKKSLNLVLTIKGPEIPPLKPLQSGVQPRPAGTLSGVSELQHVSSATRSASGNISRVPQTRSDWTSPTSSVAHGQFETESKDSLTRVMKYSNDTVHLDLSSPPVIANRASVSRRGVVSPAQSSSCSSESVTNSSVVSSRQTVSPHYHRGNTSVNHGSAERSPTTPKTTSTTPKKDCVLM